MSDASKASTPTQFEIEKFYAERLCFLWEKYIRLIEFGIFTSGTTLVLLVNAFVFNKDVHDLLLGLCTKTQCLADWRWLAVAIIASGGSGICFIGSRWCSQILMERQVYGDRAMALTYFTRSLGNETVLPSALQPKAYVIWFFKTSSSFLKFSSNANEFLKFLGVALTILTWVATMIYIYPLIPKIHLLPVGAP